MDSTGQNAIAIWMIEDLAGDFFVKAARSSNSGNSWNSITNLDPSNPADYWMFPHIAMDDSGHAIAVWTFPLGVNNYVKTAFSSDWGATWSSATTINPLNISANWIVDPQVVMGLSGNAIITWTNDDGGLQNFTYTTISSDYGKTWSSPAQFRCCKSWR